MQHNYKNPIYEFSIDSRECSIDLKINGLPCFSNYEPGGVALDWPVNTNLLSSGKQSYSLSLMPYEDEDFINKKAIVKAKISVRDSLDLSKPRLLISEISIPDFSKEEDLRKELHIRGEFDANIPYNHEGWTNSVNIINEDKELLFEELKDFYDGLYTIFKTHNIDKYKSLTNVRFRELCGSFYLNDEEMKRREVLFIPKFKGAIGKVPIENYEMIFLGEGKLVALRIPNEPIGLKFISDDDTDNIIYEQAIFHRKNPEDSLSLIR